jgi:hypothetical protein
MYQDFTIIFYIFKDKLKAIYKDVYNNSSADFYMYNKYIITYKMLKIYKYHSSSSSED